MTISEYKEQRDKLFKEETCQILGNDIPMLNSFHNTSIEGILDFVAEWAEGEMKPIGPIWTENPDAYVIYAEMRKQHNAALTSLLTFIGRNNK